MRIYETKNSRFIAEDLKSLKISWLNTSKIYLKDVKMGNYSIKSIFEVKDISEVIKQKLERSKFLSTKSMLAKEYPLSKTYPYDFKFDLNPTNFVLRYARKKKSLWYFIFSHMANPIRLGYEATLQDNIMQCTCISGYEFNEKNKIRGLDFNFMRPTKSVPMGYDEMKIIKFTSTKHNSKMNKSCWMINDKFKTKATMCLMEMEQPKSKASEMPFTDW